MIVCMVEPVNKIKENIKKIAYFATRALKLGSVWSFRQIEEELHISKAEILATFELFRRARIFDYKIMPWNPSDEEYDLGEPKEVIEDKTGGFMIFFGNDASSAIKKLESLFDADGEYIGGKTKTRKSKNAEIKLSAPKKKSGEQFESKLLGLIESPSKLDGFLKKYGKHFNLPTSSNETEVSIGKLKINIATGDFVYCGTKGNISPKTQGYKILTLLISSPNHLSDYDSITKTLYPFLDKANNSIKFNIQQVVKKTKTKLGILPHSKKSNPEFIQNIPNFGYRIVVG